MEGNNGKQPEATWRYFIFHQKKGVNSFEVITADH